MNKKLRQNVYKIVRNKQDKQISSDIICNKLIQLDKFRAANTIFCYMSLSLEVDTTKIIDTAIKQSKKVAVPITGDTLQFVEIDSDTQFVTAAFGVKEPIGGKKLDNCDIIIVPMVAFDKNCNRLGHGKGFYDKFLANKDYYKIGIAFSEQYQNFVVHDHDQPMDMVITEKDIYINQKSGDK